jgi:hypothetical protein
LGYFGLERLFIPIWRSNWVISAWSDSVFQSGVAIGLFQLGATLYSIWRAIGQNLSMEYIENYDHEWDRGWATQGHAVICFQDGSF